MEIKWLGHASFEVKSKAGTTIIIDPFDDAIGLKWKKRHADILLISHEHHDHNNQAGVDAYFTAEGPGEYEVKEIPITAIRTYHDTETGAERGVNTCYSFVVDGLTVCHLGDLGHKLSGEQAEELSGADVLMVPVGGHYTIDGATAAEVVSQLEPQVVIPMHYQTPDLKLSQQLDEVGVFMKALGQEQWEAQPSFRTSSRDSLSGEMRVIVLEPAKS